MYSSRKISDNSIRRLPKYLRRLQEAENNRVDRISSDELARLLGYTSSQVRQDLNYFGSFGQRGYGYNVAELRAQLLEILGTNCGFKGILVGTGKIGQALLESFSFRSCGIDLMAAFDSKPELAGLKFNGFTVHRSEDMGEYVKEHHVETAILCVTRNGAQRTAEELAEMGIKSILNFTNVDILLPNTIVVENINFIDSAYVMNYYLAKRVESKR